MNILMTLTSRGGLGDTSRKTRFLYATGLSLVEAGFSRQVKPTEFLYLRRCDAAAARGSSGENHGVHTCKDAGLDIPTTTCR
jgi:hypothetical protein